MNSLCRPVASMFVSLGSIFQRQGTVGNYGLLCQTAACRRAHHKPDQSDFRELNIHQNQKSVLSTITNLYIDMDCTRRLRKGLG